MEIVIICVRYLVLVIIVLISVAFFTLIEQKIIGRGHLRLGPNYVGYLGLLQPFADAVKLLSKEEFLNKVRVKIIYLISPLIILVLSLVIWILYPFVEGALDLVFGVFLFVCLRGLFTYPLLISGWSRNCKYSMLGSLRSVAQVISYEVRLALILLRLVWLTNRFNFQKLLEFQEGVWNVFLFFPLGLIWLVSSLAETNRSPYDFAEGESELVSGFNTEYGGAGFTLIFMREYRSLIFMGVLFSILFLSRVFRLIRILKGVIVGFVFVWVRISYPRYRYDKLIYLAWKIFLPLVLFVFTYNLGLICLI